MKIVSVAGIRPDFIRMCEIIKGLDEKFEHILIHTGQHYSHNVNDIFFEELGIRRPDINLGIKSGTYAEQTAKLLVALERELSDIEPDAVMFLGDSNTALGAIASSKMNIFTIHVEAGMRSHDWRMPEEKNRVVVDRLSSLHYVYTERYKENLLYEGFNPKNIFVCGNPIVDIVNKYKDRAGKSGILNRLKLEYGDYFLTTIHRAENVDDKDTLIQILMGLGMVYRKYKKPIIYPMYYRTQKRIKEMGLSSQIPEGVQVMDPLGFFEFLDLEGHSLCNITDSGTVQEESLIMRTPCVTARQSTERPETVEVGANIVAGVDAGDIYRAVETMVSSRRDWDVNVLGDGHASEYIIDDLKKREKQIMNKEHLLMDPFDFRKRNCFMKRGII